MHGASEGSALKKVLLRKRSTCYALPIMPFANPALHCVSACDPVPALASSPLAHNGEVVEIVPHTVEKGALHSHFDTLEVGPSHGPFNGMLISAGSPSGPTT